MFAATRPLSDQEWWRQGGKDVFGTPTRRLREACHPMHHERFAAIERYRSPRPGCSSPNDLLGEPLARAPGVAVTPGPFRVKLPPRNCAKSGTASALSVPSAALIFAREGDTRRLP